MLSGTPSREKCNLCKHPVCPVFVGTVIFLNTCPTHPFIFLHVLSGDMEFRQHSMPELVEAVRHPVLNLGILGHPNANASMQMLFFSVWGGLGIMKIRIWPIL